MRASLRDHLYEEALNGNIEACQKLQRAEPCPARESDRGDDDREDSRLVTHENFLSLREFV